MAQNFLEAAARVAGRGMRKGAGGPFGAVIVRKGKIVASAHNSVLKDKNATCHAEINAIRIASKKLKRFALNDCTIYSTTEPCPMCFSAIHWATIPLVVYGTVIADVHKLGFNELTISNQRMKKWGKSPVKLKRVKDAACLKLLADWRRLPKKRTY